VLNQQELMNQWLNGLRIAQMAHARTAARYDVLHRALGIPATVLAAAVGTTVFASLGQQKNLAVLVSAGIASIAAAVLSALQTFLDYAGASQLHKRASARYGAIRRQLEELIVSNPNEDQLRKGMEKVRASWTSVEDESPIVPQRYHDAAKRRVVKPSV
jgi:hypothetical protein